MAAFANKKSHGHRQSPTACSFYLVIAYCSIEELLAAGFTCEAPDDTSKEAETKQIVRVNCYRIRHRSVVPFPYTIPSFARTSVSFVSTRKGVYL
jgi:hypothetical protein